MKVDVVPQVFPMFYKNRSQHGVVVCVSYNIFVHNAFLKIVLAILGAERLGI